MLALNHRRYPTNPTPWRPWPLTLCAGGLALLVGLPHCGSSPACEQDCTQSDAGADAPAPECTAEDATTACDDQSACTTDACVEGACQHTAMTGTACGMASASGVCDASGACVNGALAWAERFGNGDGLQEGDAIVADRDRNVVVAGSFSGTVDLGFGPMTSPMGDFGIFLAKLDPTGKGIWGMPLAQTITGYVNGLTTDKDGNIVLGLVAGGNSVTKLDPSGKVVWNRSFTAPNQQAMPLPSAIVADGSGNLVVAGALKWPADFGAGVVSPKGLTDLFVVKLDKDGGIALTGSMGGTVDFGGGPLTAQGAQDNILVLKLDAQGKHVFSRIYTPNPTGNDFVLSRGVAVDDAGDVFVVGQYQGKLTFGSTKTLTTTGKFDDGFLVKLDPTGEALWSKRLGGSGEDMASAVTADAEGNTVVLGAITGPVDFGGGPVNGTAFLVKLGPDGQHLWSKGLDHTNAYALARDPGGRSLATGVITGTVDFGGQSLMTTGNYDIFVAAFAP